MNGSGDKHGKPPVRVAVPTDDGAHISAHPGRCKGFVTYVIENGTARMEGYRENSARHEHGHGVPAGGPHVHHDHSEMVGLLEDCGTVLSGGMGPRLIEDLEANGISIVFTYEQDIAAAVTAMAEGRLIGDQPRSRCRRQ